MGELRRCARWLVGWLVGGWVGGGWLVGGWLVGGGWCAAKMAAIHAVATERDTPVGAVAGRPPYRDWVPTGYRDWVPTSPFD